MNDEQLLLITASFLVESGLLWMASEVGVLAGARPAALARVLTAGAALLFACGLWWPGHVMESSGAAHPVIVALSALSLAGLVLGFRVALRSGRMVEPAIIGVALTVAAYGHALLATPSLFNASRGWGLLEGGGVLAAMCLALAASQMTFVGKRHARLMRGGAACVAAAMSCLAAAVSGAGHARSVGALVPDLLLMGGLLCTSGVLLFVLLQIASGVAEAALRPTRAAVVDNLTRLPTRLFFETRLAAAAEACQQRNSKLAVLFVDLDGFKPINDTFGHSAGDRVLERVGKRLRSLTRGDGVAARVGGDEFLLMVTGVGNPESVAKMAEHLIASLSRPYRVDDREVSISCSVGIAMFPDSCNPGKLVARADAAMYSAKRAGGSRHCFYSREMDADVQQNFDTLRDLRQALAGNELELFFQPKIDARSGKVTAAEALLRWQHPTRGMLLPSEFIPLAERSGLIGPLGNWVIEAAFKQARAWRDQGLRMRVAINLSAYQMRQDDIAERIADALERNRIHPSLLTCEITESAAMEDTLATQETFRRLGELGAHLSIDDFGTGYSSLAYLRQLPAEELKIDASFVNDLENSSDARAVVDAVIKLAHALGLKVVAEGIENPRQHQILVAMGCDELQGYLFAKPMSARALLLWAVSEPRSDALAFRESLFGETREQSYLSVQSSHSMQPAHSAYAARTRGAES